MSNGQTTSRIFGAGIGRGPVAVVSILFVVLAASACGEEGDGGSGPIGPPPGDEDTGADVAVEDAGEMPDTTPPMDTDPDNSETGTQDVDPMSDGMDLDAGDGGDGMSCGDSSCEADEVCNDEQECVSRRQAKCDAAESVGTLSLGETLQIDDQFSEFGGEETDVLDTACVDSEETTNELVYQFEIEETAQVSVDYDFMGQWTAGLEFRRGSCLDGEDEYGGCQTGPSPSFYAPGGSTWYLVVEHSAGTPGEFSIDLEAVETCSFGPPGESSCDQGDKYLCERIDGTPTETQFECADGCTDAECAGDSCDNPITVNGAGDGGTFSGDLAGYSADYNFANADESCKPEPDSTDRIDSSGQDVIFEVTAEEGDEISVDTTGDSYANLVYIADFCHAQDADMSCQEAWNDSLEEGGTWSVPSDGTYFVFIDRFNSEVQEGEPFEYQVNVQ